MDPHGFPFPLHRDERGGDAVPVVLFHGFPDTAASWDGIADALVAAGHRVVVPHLRGYHPQTIVTGRRYRARDLAEDAVAILDATGVDRAVLVGHDWGAAMAYGGASLAPERVAGVVGVAIPHPRTLRPTPSMAWNVRHFLTLKLPGIAARVRADDFAYIDTLYARWAPNWSGPERERCLADVKQAFADPVVLDAAIAYYRDLSPRSEPDLVRRLDMPGLVIGSTDDLVPESAFQRSRRAFNDRVEVLIVDGAGHWPHREDEPAVTAALLDFAASVSG